MNVYYFNKGSKFRKNKIKKDAKFERDHKID